VFQEKQRKKLRPRRNTGSKSLRVSGLGMILTLVRLHQAGKTDQAKADLARLAKIRKDREAAQAARKAEEEGE
jgi:hypothetical protein